MPTLTGGGGDRSNADDAALVAQVRECGIIATVGLWIGLVFFGLCLASASIFDSYWLTLIALAAAAFGFGVFAHYRFRIRQIKSNVEGPWSP